MPYILRPRGATDLAGATLYNETALPQTLSGLTAGTYEIGRVSWQNVDLVVTTPPVTGSTFLIGSGSPNTYFLDPSALGANVTRLRRRARMKLVSYPTTGYTALFSQQTNYMELQLLSQGGGTSAMWQYAVKDSGGNNMTSTTPRVTGIAVPALNTWFTVEFDVDMAARTIILRVDGTAIVSESFSGTPVSNFFISATNRRLMDGSYLSTGSALFPAGTEFEFIETYKTIGGTETLHHRVTGPAATANADPWKQGANAT